MSRSDHLFFLCMIIVSLLYVHYSTASVTAHSQKQSRQLRIGEVTTYPGCDFYDLQEIAVSCQPEVTQVRKEKVPKNNSPKHWLPYNNIIQPILFVPKNLHYDDSVIAAINETTPIITSWYAGQLSGATFSSISAQIVIGQKSLKEYCPSSVSDTQCIKTIGDGQATGQEGLWEVINDLAQQGYDVRPGIVYIIYWMGGYGRAVGARYSADSGFALVGDWALDGILGKYEDHTATGGCSDSGMAALCSKTTQFGTIAHELGHAFGLPHPSDDGTTIDNPEYWMHSVMHGFWEFPTSILIESATNPEKSTLLVHPFFRRSDLFNRVQPILFLPRGQTVDLHILSQIDMAFRDVQHWYATHMSGVTFQFTPPHIIVGRHSIDYYCSYPVTNYQCVESPGYSGVTGENIDTVLGDIQSQGYQGNDHTIFVVFWVGAYGYAGGQQTGASSGYTILGDWALDGIAGKYETNTATSNCSDSPYAVLFCTKNAQLGTIAYVLGASFGLQPSVDDGTTEGEVNYWQQSVMRSFWSYPNVTLLNSTANPEQQILAAHPFFAPTYTIFSPLTLK